MGDYFFGAFGCSRSIPRSPVTYILGSCPWVPIKTYAIYICITQEPTTWVPGLLGYEVLSPQACMAVEPRKVTEYLYPKERYYLTLNWDLLYSKHHLSKAVGCSKLIVRSGVRSNVARVELLDACSCLPSMKTPRGLEFKVLGF